MLFRGEITSISQLPSVIRQEDQSTIISVVNSSSLIKWNLRKLRQIQNNRVDFNCTPPQAFAYIDNIWFIAFGNVLRVYKNSSLLYVR